MSETDPTVRELQDAADLRVTEQAAALAAGEHYWVFTLTFAAGPPGDDMVIDMAAIRGAGDVQCATCGSTTGLAPCLGSVAWGGEQWLS